MMTNSPGSIRSANLLFACGHENPVGNRYCDACGATLYETERHVPDYREDPVSRVYEEFYGSEAHRTCARCGWVAPVPAGAASPAVAR